MGVIRITDDGPVRIVHMCDSEGHNALDATVTRALTGALDVPPRVSVVVLRGQPDVFSRGAGDDVLRALTEGAVAPSELVLPRVFLEAEVPIIAAMEGHAIGGGLALGLAADIAILARESRYGATFMNHGFTPGMGTTRLLERVVSPAVAFEMLMTGEPKLGSELTGHGFNAVLPRKEVWPRAMEIALRIAEKPRAAVARLKHWLAAPWREAFEAAHRHEAQMHEACFAELREGEHARAR